MMERRRHDHCSSKRYASQSGRQQLSTDEQQLRTWSNQADGMGEELWDAGAVVEQATEDAMDPEVDMISLVNFLVETRWA